MPASALLVTCTSNHFCSLDIYTPPTCSILNVVYQEPLRSSSISLWNLYVVSTALLTSMLSLVLTCPALQMTPAVKTVRPATAPVSRTADVAMMDRYGNGQPISS